jgi:mono/diheme cytochrome c family protein
LKKANFITIIALLTMVAALPAYIVREPFRMEQKGEILRQKELVEAGDLYVEHCVSCHGLGGEGLDQMPALNSPALADADAKRLFNIIAHAPHNTTMAAWHLDEGGILSTYQVDKLVTLIRFGDWYQVGMLAASKNILNPEGPNPDMVEVFSKELDDPDHQCVACHEEPDLHAGVFGVQCARCHTISAWSPAYLTLHTFILDHGENESKSCETCHISNYPDYTCYGCHDHQVEDMETVHLAEQISDITQCADCHPTGVAGEAGRLRDLQIEPFLIELSKTE